MVDFKQQPGFKWANMAAVVVYIGVAYTIPFKGAASDVHMFSLVLAALYIGILTFSPRLERMAAQRAFQVRISVRETGGIFGLLLTFLSHDPKYSLFFGIPALLLLALA